MLSCQRECGAWRGCSSSNRMPEFGLPSFPSFSMAGIVANVLFSGVGFVAFTYGKKMQVWRPMVIGIALMAYTYFFQSEVMLYGIGSVLTTALFVFRD